MINLQYECTAGSFYGTQYDQNETPTIEACAILCLNDPECEGITYGTEEGFISETGYTSDGGRMNDCIFVTNTAFVSGWEEKCRWNTY
eukprot:UN30298